MNKFQGHVKLLLVALTLIASVSLTGAPATAAQNTNSSTTMQEDDSILRGTRQCVRDAAKRYQRCLKRGGKNKGRRTRCRITYNRERSACSG